MDEATGRDDLAAKDRRIDDLVIKAEKLVADLNSTVNDMRRILGIAAQQVQEARDEQQRGRGDPGGGAAAG